MHVRSQPHEGTHPQIHGQLSRWAHHKSLGKIPEEYFQITVGALILIGVLILVGILCYRKYRTERDYNDTPENFSHVPDLGIIQQYHLSNSNFVSITPEQVLINQKRLHDGVVFETTFDAEKTGIYFNNLLKSDAYFEIEILQLNSLIEVGFINACDLDALKDGENLGRLGVSIDTEGQVQLGGETLLPYQWEFKYGDTLGIGVTKHGSTKRVWLSKNGVLQNPPSQQEIDQWILESNIDSENKEKYETQLYKPKESQLDKESKESSRGKTEKNQRKRVITIKNLQKFEYYAVIGSQQLKPGKKTILNINVGGQIFRMFDTKLKSGLLD